MILDLRCHISCEYKEHLVTTVDGRNPANQLRLVVYPIIPLFTGFYTSQVVQDFFHNPMNPEKYLRMEKQSHQFLRAFIIGKDDDYPTSYVGLPFVLGEIDIPEASFFIFPHFCFVLRICSS